MFVCATPEMPQSVETCSKIKCIVYEGWRKLNAVCDVITDIRIQTVAVICPLLYYQFWLLWFAETSYLRKYAPTPCLWFLIYNFFLHTEYTCVCAAEKQCTSVYQSNHRDTKDLARSPCRAPLWQETYRNRKFMFSGSIWTFQQNISGFCIKLGERRVRLVADFALYWKGPGFKSWFAGSTRLWLCNCVASCIRRQWNT